MNYIINPAIFYWMSVANGFKAVFVTVAIVGCIALALIPPLYLFDSYSSEKEKATAKQWLKWILGITLVSVIGLIFVPGEKTMTQMLVANFATYDMADNVVEAVRNTADYIIGAVRGVQG